MTQKTNKLWGYRHGVISNMHLWTCLVHQVVTSEGAAERNSDNMKCTVEGVGEKKTKKPQHICNLPVSKNVQTDEWLVNFINISHNHSAKTTAVTTEEVTLNCMQSHFTQKVLLELFNNQQETPKHVFVKSTLENLKATSCPFIEIKEKVPDVHTLRVIVIYVRV